MSKLTIKKVFTVCREKIGSSNGAPISRLVDENLRKECAMLAQAETITKVPFANRNGVPDKSDGSDTQVAKINKDLTLVRREKLRGSRITTSSQREEGKRTCRAQFQEQDGRFSVR